MVRKQKKPKAGHQKPKWRKQRGGGGGGAGGGGGGDTASTSSGTMSSLRGAFKRTVRGGGDKKPSTISRVIDGLLWVAVGVAVVYFIANMKCS